MVLGDMFGKIFGGKINSEEAKNHTGFCTYKECLETRKSIKGIKKLSEEELYKLHTQCENCWGSNKGNIPHSVQLTRGEVNTAYYTRKIY